MLEDIVLNVVDLMINSLEAKLEERIMNIQVGSLPYENELFGKAGG